MALETGECFLSSVPYNPHVCLDFVFIYHFFGYAASEIYMHLVPGENVDQTKYN